MPLPILEVLQVDDDVFVPVRARVLMPEAQQVQQLVQDSVNGCNLAQDQTSWPYFGVKLSCVCLKFAYRKKSNDLY